MNKKTLFFIMLCTSFLGSQALLKAEEQEELSQEEYDALKTDFEASINQYLEQLKGEPIYDDLKEWSHAYTSVFFGSSQIEEAMKQADLNLLDVVHKYATENREAELAPKFESFLIKLTELLKQDNPTDFEEFITLFEEQLNGLKQEGIRALFFDPHMYDEYKKVIPASK